MKIKIKFKQKIKIVATLFILFLLMGCGAINKTMNSWMNHHYSELIGLWGPPTQVYDDGNGGRILVYIYTSTYTTPATSTTTTNSNAYGNATIYDNMIWGNVNSTTQSSTTYNPAQTYEYTAYRMFWINKSGYVYSWRWKGL